MIIKFQNGIKLRNKKLQIEKEHSKFSIEKKKIVIDPNDVIPEQKELSEKYTCAICLGIVKDE